MASRLDKMYDILKKNKGPVEFNDLYKRLMDTDEDTDGTAYDKSSIFTDLSIDGRFLFTRKAENKKDVQYWDIRDNYTYDEIKKSLSSFGTIGELIADDEEEEEIQGPDRPAIASDGTSDDEEKNEEEIDDSPAKDIDNS